MAEIYNIRDYQSAKDQERIAKLAREIMEQVWEAGAGPGILNGVGMSTDGEAVWYGGAGIDGMKFEAPERDPA